MEAEGRDIGEGGDATLGQREAEDKVGACAMLTSESQSGTDMSVSSDGVRGSVRRGAVVERSF